MLLNCLFYNRNMRIAPMLYKMARTVNTIEAFASGNPVRIARRLKNIFLGRFLARSGFGKIWR